MKLSIKKSPPPRTYRFTVKGKSGELECVFYPDPILCELENLFYQSAFQTLYNGEREPPPSDYQHHIASAFEILKVQIRIALKDTLNQIGEQVKLQALSEADLGAYR